MYFFLPKDCPIYQLYLMFGFGARCVVWCWCVTCAGGLSLGAAYLLPWSMLPDVIDEIELRTNERSEAIYYSFFVFFQKFATAGDCCVLRR